MAKNKNGVARKEGENSGTEGRWKERKRESKNDRYRQAPKQKGRSRVKKAGKRSVAKRSDCARHRQRENPGREYDAAEAGGASGKGWGEAQREATNHGKKTGRPREKAGEKRARGKCREQREEQGAVPSQRNRERRAGTLKCEAAEGEEAEGRRSKTLDTMSKRTGKKPKEKREIVWKEAETGLKSNAKEDRERGVKAQESVRKKEV